MAGGALTDEQVLDGLGGDFRGLLDAKKVPTPVQVLLGRRHVDSTELFAVLADSRDGMREAARTALGLDPANDQITIAKLVVAWEAASLRMSVTADRDAQSTSERQPKTIPMNDYMGVRRQFETTYYEMRDEEIPSKNSLEDLADQMETGDWRAMSLKEIACRSDVESDAQWSSLTVGKAGQIKMKKSSVETPAPRDMEELRQKLKVLGHHFVFLKMLNPTRKEFEDVTPFTFAQYADYLLSKRVARLQAEDESGAIFHTPSLKQVLTYDFYVRKKMVETLSATTPLGQALKDAMQDSTVKERHFTTPLSVSAAAQDRKASLRTALQQLCGQRGVELAMEEWDILRGSEQDLSNPQVVDALMGRIAAGEFDFIFMSPPCNTWSRAPHSNPWGPRPIRNRFHPWGFPWLEGKFKDLAQLGNVLVDLCFKICDLVRLKLPHVGVIWEHPEDLGSSWDHKGRPVYPASVWQLPAMAALLNAGWFTVAFFQCRFGVDRLKPTRLLANLQSVAQLGILGPPILDDDGWYLGPLPETCIHGGHPPLIKRSAEEAFHTTGTGVYPPAMDAALAELILGHYLQTLSSKGVGTALEISEGDEREVTTPMEEVTLPMAVAKEEEKGDGSGVIPTQGAEKEDGKEDLDGESLCQEETGDGASQDKPVTGMKGHPSGKGPMKACYKGKLRPVHDGLGLCSMGRLASCNREASTGCTAPLLKKLFWDMLKGWMDVKGKVETSRLCAELLCGRVESQPFGDLPDQIRERWMEVLEKNGYEPRRKSGDRQSALELRLLKELAREVRDLDFEYLEEMASTGVRLGTEVGDIPRIEAVYEEKNSWSLPLPTEGKWEEEQVRGNYRSAQDHLEKVKVQIDKDVAKGHIIQVTLEEARRRYGTDLKVASLAAVPKDTEWDEVRVVHDATHGVEVNHQIRVNNRMRFPLFDDLEAVVRQFLDEADSRKVAVAFDYKGAHRLVPIHEDDWGKQAFRLGSEEEVYLNCVGTFGVASAAFWWSRLAATLQRTCWVFLRYKDPLYGLLYADDGLFLSSGPFFMVNILAALLFLVVLGAPLSWPKTRGGPEVEWLGYQINLAEGLIGFSKKKVDWLDKWVSEALQQGGVLGREMKSALGRMGFLAGPLKHSRPFLSLVYRWTSKLGPGSFVQLPLAIRLVLVFFLKAVREAPMRSPRGLPAVGGEIFRIDAKADKGTVSIGGWESFNGTKPKEARWFSVELTRANAPWVFLKGEPFKVIASLELLAVTVAVMVFSPEASWKGTAGRLLLPAFTDNLANTYVLDKFMTTAFPLSVILMELALQLQKIQVDLELQWIPRDQNVEADSLTNLDYSLFDPSKRIKVNLEGLDFIALNELITAAAELDSEVTLKRSSKERSYQDPAHKLRLAQPW
eukprot:Skav210536  [mRNA]  locus=scaffold3045:358236:363217:- [translate_table: standard]